MQYARSGPLTWGQHTFWFLNEPMFLREYGPEHYVERALRLPADLTRVELEWAVNAAADAHEALRTVYGELETGEPQQRVLARYAPPLIERGDGAVEPVDIRERPSFRCLIRTEGDTVTEATIRANQIDLDGYALARLGTEIETELAGGSARRGEPVQPLDCAAVESQAARQDGSNEAILALTDLWRTAPRNFLPPLALVVDGGTGDTGEGHLMTLLDVDLFARVADFAERHGVSAASFFHAAIGAAMAAWTQTFDLFVTTAVSNRWRSECKEMIGRIASEVDCGLEFPEDATAADFIELTHARLMRAYPRAVRDEEAGVAAKDRIDSEAGSVLSRPVRIEYLDFHTAAAELPPGAGRRRISQEIVDGDFDHFIFTVFPSDRGLGLSMTCGRIMAEADEAAAVFNGVVALADAFLDDPRAPLSTLLELVPSRTRTDSHDWITTGNSRHSLERLREGALSLPGVARAEARAEGDGLVLLVAGDRPDLTALHEWLLVRASHDPLIRVPTSYRLLEPAQGDPDWTAGRTVATMAVREDYRPSTDDDPRIKAMADVFRRCNPGRPCDPAKSYAALGGRFTRIPGMVAGLRELGCETHPGDFTGLASLAAIARRQR